MLPDNGRGRPGGQGGLRSIHSGSGLDRLKSTPTDFVVTLSDHGRGEFLVEVREDGRLTSRRFLTYDAVLIEGHLAFLVHDALQRRRERDAR